MKLAVLFTGGKDSTYALYLAQKQGHEITVLITIKSKNPDSYMFHTPAIELVRLQAESLGLPILIEESKGEKEAELADLEKAIKKAQARFKFAGLVTGALYSEYQSTRIENIAQRLGLKTFSPLWHKPQEEHLQEIIENGFKIIFTSIAAEGLDKNWLNKIITEKEILQLKGLHQKTGLHLAGEGGEFESLVVDCLLFRKRLVLEEVEIKEENKNTARLIVKKARLEEK